MSNPFDQFDEGQTSAASKNPFDQFDSVESPSVVAPVKSSKQEGDSQILMALKDGAARFVSGIMKKSAGSDSLRSQGNLSPAHLAAMGGAAGSMGVNPVVQNLSSTIKQEESGLSPEQFADQQAENYSKQIADANAVGEHYRKPNADGDYFDPELNSFTFDKVAKNYAENNVVDATLKTADNFAAAVPEAIAGSLPYMVNAPATAVSVAGDVTEERRKNSNENLPTADDALTGLGVGSAVGILERILPKFLTRSNDVAQKEAADSAVKYAIANTSKEAAAAGGIEFATEFNQNIIQYLGERIGTDAAVDYLEMLKQSTEQGVVGAGAGAAMGVPSGIARSVQGIQNPAPDVDQPINGESLPSEESLVEPVEPAGLEHKPERMISMPDGSVAWESELPSLQADAQAQRVISQHPAYPRLTETPESIEQNLDAPISVDDEINQLLREQTDYRAQKILARSPVAQHFVDGELNPIANDGQPGFGDEFIRERQIILDAQKFWDEERARKDVPIEVGVKPDYSEEDSGLFGESRRLMDQAKLEPIPQPRQPIEQIADVYPPETKLVPGKADTRVDVAMPSTFNDSRLTRPEYRSQLERAASELVQGGGVSFVRDSNDRIVGRTPSLNPDWFKSANDNPDVSMSVVHAKSAIQKALAGEKLGVRETRMVGAALDHITGERGQYAAELIAKRQLARDARKAAFESWQAETNVPDDADFMAMVSPEKAGEVYSEQDYDIDLDYDDRAVSELVDHAVTMGADWKQIDAALELSDIDQQSKALTNLIWSARNEHRQTQARAQAPGRSGQGAQTGRSLAEEAPNASPEITPESLQEPSPSAGVSVSSEPEIIDSESSDIDQLKARLAGKNKDEQLLEFLLDVIDGGTDTMSDGGWPHESRKPAIELSKRIQSAMDSDDYSSIMDDAYQTLREMLKNDDFGEFPELIAIEKQLSRYSLDATANEAATSPTNDLPAPTEAQKEAGNYKKGHVRIQGLDISIENPKGSIRSGTDSKGKKWEVTMDSHYGYIKKTEGADGDHVDVFVGPNPDSDKVFIVDQINPDGSFDEHKVMLGYDSKLRAKTGYSKNYSKGWKVGPITSMTMDEFKDWLKTDKTKKPISNEIDSKATAPEHQNNQGKPLDEESVYPKPDEPAKEQASWFNPDAMPLNIEKEDFLEITNEWSDLFTNDKTVRANDYAGDYVSKLKAKTIIDQWKARAKEQFKNNRSENSDKTILSLFDLSGEWSKPWREAGYNVITFDIQTGQDVMDFDVDYFLENWDFGDVYGILAACPCTDFASSGARHFAAKDADGRTEASKELVFQTLRTIEYFRPKIWALENPVGRIERLTGLPKAKYIFDPHHFGETYTKKTMLWGRFNPELPTANVEPVDGSIMHKKYGGKSQKTKNARSVTPEGFAYSFFMANNYIDMPADMRLELDYPMVSGAVKSALKAGVSEDRIHELMEDTYENYEYDEARQALLDEIAELGSSQASTDYENLLNEKFEKAKKSILSDIKNGVIAGNVNSFSDLHDYVDANQYVNDASGERLIGKFGKTNGWKTEDYTKFTNAIIKKIDEWIRAENDEIKRVSNSKALADGTDTNVGTNSNQQESVSQIEYQQNIRARSKSGDLKIDEFKSAFESLIKNREQITAEISKFSKDKLISMLDPIYASRAKTEKKEYAIESVYRNMVTQYYYIAANAGMMSIPYSNKSDHTQDYIDATRPHVEAATQDRLDEVAKDFADSKRELEESKKRKMEGLKDPKTLDDFRNLHRAILEDNPGITVGEARMKMTAAQRIEYDRLNAIDTRSKRVNQKEARKTSVSSAGQTVDGSIIETKHTKKGHDLFVVQLAERVSKEDYSALSNSAKRLGGYYSSFRGAGAVPGFQFPTKESAQAFLELAGGNTETASELAKELYDVFQDNKSQSTAERLRSMAAAMSEHAEQELTRDRKANTTRRAGMAARALESAEREKAMAETMQLIADGIDSGELKFLDKVRTKAQLLQIQTTLQVAKGDEIRSKFENYANQIAHKDDPITLETVEYAVWPTYTAFRSDLAKLARQMIETDGLKMLGRDLLKVADDTSAEYTKFAKENLDKVSVFMKQDGSVASFKSKAAAAESIERSGFSGKAIPLEVKRGETRIILSASEAQTRGIWEGADQRITLTYEFAEKIIESAARKNRKKEKVSVPWQLETVYEKRQRYLSMGIETPAEFRAALREFVSLAKQPEATSKVKKLELAMVGRKNDGLDFFPTPQSIADEMIQSAEIQAGMSVLEPSAGMGHIADRIREFGAEPDVVEISESRRELLEAKGYNLVGRDFMEYKNRDIFGFGDTFKADDGSVGILRGHGGLGSDRVMLVDENGDGVGKKFFSMSELTPVKMNGSGAGYDRIIMNPPFSDRRDMDHVLHAYDLLKPGGRIVAIVGEGVMFGSDKKATGFREWLDRLGATSEKLEEGTFNDPSLPVTTGVNARMLVIDKPTDSDIRFSLDNKPNNVVSGISVDEVESTVAEIKKAWINPLIKIEVVENIDGMPTAVKNKIDLLGDDDDVQFSVSKNKKVKAVFYNGSVYINASAMKDKQDVERAIFHEVHAHYGLRALFGRDASSAMGRLYFAIGGDKGIRDIAKKHGIDLSKYDKILKNESPARRTEIMTEELLAHIAQDSRPSIKRWVQELIGAIRIWLRAHGFLSMSLFSDSEIMALLKRSREAATELKLDGGSLSKVLLGDQGGTSPDDDINFSVDDWDEVLRQLDYAEETETSGGDSDDYKDALGFLSNAQKANTYTSARLLRRIRKSSDAIANELGGKAEGRRRVASVLGNFSGYTTRAEIIEADSIYPNGRIEIYVYGDEQIKAGLTQEPALTFVVAADGELTVNAATGETFEEFKARGWARAATGKDGRVQDGWNALVDKNGGNIPTNQMLPLLADVHARARIWKKADKIGLKWSRSTGATGEDGGGRKTAVYFSLGDARDDNKSRLKGGFFSSEEKDLTGFTPELTEGYNALGGIDRDWKSVVRRKIKDLVAPFGNLPTFAKDLKIDRDGRMNADNSDTQFYLRDFHDRIAEVYGKSYESLSPATKKEINDYLKGDRDRVKLTETTIAALSDLRSHIKRMSAKLANTYIKDAEMLELDASNMDIEGRSSEAAAKRAQAEDLRRRVDTIVNNFDTYLHRSYRAFDDPKWPEKLKNKHPQVYRRAVEFIAQQYADGETPTSQDLKAAAKKVDLILHEGTAYDSLASFVAESKLGAKDLGITKKRKDISPEIRALLGEYEDPAMNYAKTVTKISRLVHNSEFLRDFRQKGIEAGILFDGENRELGATAKVAGDASEVYSPLNGLYTYPEILKSLKDAVGKNNEPEWLKALVLFSGSIKYGKTVLAPTTAMRNIISASQFVLGNGHFDFTHAGKALDSLKTYFNNKDYSGSRAYIKKMLELGVLYDSPNYRELQDFINRVNESDGLAGKVMEKTWLGPVLEKAQTFYAIGDDFWKIIGFENEKALLMEHHKLSERDAEKEAAQRIRNTYPTYSLVGRGIRNLGRYPVLAAFPSFTSEIIRTTFHKFRYLNEDRKKLGATNGMVLRKATGLALQSSLTYAMAAAAAAIYGIGDDEEEAIRDGLPEWSKNSTLMILGRNDKGNIEYVDMGWVDPYSYFKKPISALFRDEPTEDRIKGALWEAVAPFASPDILPSAISKYVADIQNPNKTDTEAAGGLIKTLSPGIFTNAMNMASAVANVVEDNGKTYSVTDEALALIGIRKSTLNPKVALTYKAYAYGDAKQNANAELRKKAQSLRDVSLEELREAYDKAVKGQSDAWEEMRRSVRMAMKSGLSKMDATIALKTAGVSKSDARRLVNDMDFVYKPSKQMMKLAIKKAAAIQGEEAENIMRERKRQMDKIFNEARN